MAYDDDDGQEAEPLAFGPFTLFASERQLVRDGAPVRIGSRSLDLLVHLVRNAGTVVSKDELLGQVWGGVTVDEGALRVHINGLRKALREGEAGARYIVNVPGRGYSFTAAVSMRPPRDPVVPAPRSRADLPPIRVRTVGREGEVLALVEKVRATRFVSLVGPGGIGKTTVAVETLHRLRSTFDSRIFFVNLSAVGDPRLVASTVASMLRVGSATGDGLPELIDFLQQSECLLALDSCEHVLEAVAALAEEIVERAPLAMLLTTTREPLRVAGENVVRLPALECPPEAAILSATECLAYPAAELFVERVRANLAGFQLDDDNAPVVARICRKLDGVALALELCAGRVEAYGLADTVDLLERRLGLLWDGRRTAPPRHRTLHATLDWSYELLSETERIVFARLAVFAGSFTLRGVEWVAEGGVVDRIDAIDVVGSLVAKSIVTPVPGDGSMRYRLLDTTRTFALQKLRFGHDGGDDVARRHAEFYMRDASEPRAGEAASGWLLDHLSDVRCALEWCFAEGGDRAVGVAIVAAVATPLLELALCGECMRWTELAIANLAEAQRSTPIEIELQASLGWSAMFCSGKGDAVHGAFRRGLSLAAGHPDPHQRLRLLNGLSFVLSRECDHAGGLELAEQAAAEAGRTSDPSLMALADWALGVSHHLYGNQAQVLGHCDSALAPAPGVRYARSIADYGYDYRGRALIARARALWLQGRGGEATEAALFAIEETERLDHPISTFVVLVYAATVFIWCEEWAQAEGTISRLRAHSQAQSLVYRDIGAALGALLRCSRRHENGDLEDLRGCLERLVAERHLILVPLCRTVLATGLLVDGLAEQAREVIDLAVADLGPQVDGPEVLRVKGEVMAALGDVDQGQSFVRRAIASAREQSASAWELRASVSLVRLSAGRERDAALAELAVIYGRIDGWHASREVSAAELLLRDLETEGVFATTLSSAVLEPVSPRGFAPSLRRERWSSSGGLRSRLGPAVFILSLIVCIASRAAAQESAPVGRPQISGPAQAKVDDADIVVTATRRSERLREVPATITAMDSATLSKTGTTTLDQVADRTPGFLVTKLGDSRPRLYIRGVGTREYDPGSESSVGVFVDDVYVGRQSAVLSSLQDVERVEVLKGPQSTLYGRNTIGGAINVISKAPTTSFTAEGRVGLGSFAEREIFGVVSGPLRGDAILGRLMAYSVHDDGYVTNLTTGHRSQGRDETGFRARLLVRPAEGLRVDLIAGLSRGSGSSIDGKSLGSPTDPGGTFFSGTTIGLPGAPKPLQVSDRLADFYNRNSSLRRDTKSLTGRIEYVIPAGTFTAISSYRGTGMDETRDFDATSLDAVAQTIAERSRQFTQEILFTSDDAGPLSFGSRLRWIAGIYLYDDSTSRNDRFEFGPASVSALRSGSSQVDSFVGSFRTRSRAVFGEADLDIVPRLTLTAGLRRTEDRKQLVQTDTATLAGAGFIGADFQSPVITRDDGAWTPKVALTYRAVGGALAYVSYNRGYKGGGFQYIPTTLSAAQTTFRPESSDAYEVGANARFLGGRGTVKASAFYYDDRDLQVQRSTTLVGGGIAIVTSNAERSTVKGMELETEFRPARGIALRLAYSLVDARYDSFHANAPGQPLTPATDFSGTPIIRSPKHSLALSADYEINVGRDRTVTPHLGWTYRSEFFFEPSGGDPRFGAAIPMTRQEGYGLFDIGSTFAIGHLLIRVFADNLLNRRFLSDVQKLPFNYIVDFPGKPRTFGVTASYRF